MAEENWDGILQNLKVALYRWHMAKGFYLCIVMIFNTRIQRNSLGRRMRVSPAPATCCVEAAPAQSPALASLGPEPRHLVSWSPPLLRSQWQHLDPGTSWLYWHQAMQKGLSSQEVNGISLRKYSCGYFSNDVKSVWFLMCPSSVVRVRISMNCLKGSTLLKTFP